MEFTKLLIEILACKLYFIALLSFLFILLASYPFISCCCVE